MLSQLEDEGVVRGTLIEGLKLGGGEQMEVEW